MSNYKKLVRKKPLQRFGLTCKAKMQGSKCKDASFNKIPKSDIENPKLNLPSPE